MCHDRTIHDRGAYEDRESLIAQMVRSETSSIGWIGFPRIRTTSRCSSAVAPTPVLTPDHRRQQRTPCGHAARGAGPDRVLENEVDRLAQPPASFAVFLAAREEHTADIFTAGRKMRVSVSPDVDLEALTLGKEVMINEAMNVVKVLEFDEVGEVVLLKEMLEDGDRALVIGHGDEESVVRLAYRLRDQHLRSGDSLLIDRRVHFAYERIPKLDVEELVLEEVPDIDYSVIGGLGNQIEAIRDAVELPFLPRNSSPSTSSRRQRGSCGTAARLWQDLDRQAVANSLAKKVSERTGEEGRSFFLNIKGLSC